MSGRKQLVTLNHGVHKLEACTLQKTLQVVARNKASVDVKDF